MRPVGGYARPRNAAHARLKTRVLLHRSGGLMFLPDEGSILLYWMRCCLKRSLRRVRSRARLYQALADRETDEASRERYRLLADNERGRAARKLASLFSMRARLPIDRAPIAARAWRRLLVLCGPRVAVAWIEWRETRELVLIIAVARAITRLARLRTQRVTRPTS